MAERKRSACYNKEEEGEEEGETMTRLVKKNSSQQDARLPLDKGYAWIICFASFSIMFVLMGTVRCFGIYLNELQKTFNTSSAIISTLLGVEYFANCIAAFIVLNCLSTIWSCRVLIMIGCILCSTCFILDSCAYNVIMLPFFHVINGAGIAFMFGPSIVLIGHYFKKYRGTANALTSCGSSIGQFTLSPIISLLVSTYGIKGALLINSGLFVQCIVFALLLRPISFYISTHNVRQIYDSTANEKSKETEDLLIKIEDMAFKKKDLVNEREDLLMKTDDVVKKTEYLKIETRDLVIETDDLAIQREDLVIETDDLAIKREDLVIKTDDLATQNVDLLDKTDLVIKTGDLVIQTDDLVAIKREDLMKKREDLAIKTDLAIESKHHVIKRTSTEIEVLKQSYLSKQPGKRCETNNSPLIAKNYENNSNPVHSGEKKSVGEKKTKLSLYKRMFADISLNLFRQKIFVVLFFGCTIATVTTSVPQTYFPAYSEDIGLGRTKGAYFVSMAGFGDLGGRMLTTVLADWKYLNRTGFLGVALVVQGVIGCFASFYTSFVTFACYCVFYGIASGIYFAISITILTDLIGLEKLSQALGLILLFVGIIATAIFPAFGFLRDVTGSYHVIFILNSIGLIISGILFWSTSWVSVKN